MGVYYSFALKVGYSVSEEDFRKLFGKTDEGTFHFEDRFDSKTGAKLQPKKVWDKKPRDYLQVGDDRFGSIYEIIYQDVLKDKLGCEVDMSNTSVEQLHFTLSPPHKLRKEDMGNDLLISGPIAISTLQQMLPALLELKQKLENLGLKLGEPEVFVSSWAG